MERVASGLPPENAMAGCDQEYLALYRAIDTDALFRDVASPEPEVAFALDFSTRKVRKLGSSVGRVYGDIAEFEIPGSSDLIYRRKSNGKRVVRDYKFGQNSGALALQQMFFVAALFLLEGLDEVESEVVSIRAEDPGIGTFDVACTSVGYFQVESYIEMMLDGAKVAAAAEKRWLETGVVNVTQGDWCQWCPCKPVCPAYTGLARAMVADLTDIRGKMEAMTPVQRGEAWQKMKMAKTILEDVEAALKGIASEEPIPVGDDKEVRPSWQQKSSMSAADLEKLAVSLGANAADIDRCRRTTQYQVFRVHSKKGNE